MGKCMTDCCVKQCALKTSLEKNPRVNHYLLAKKLVKLFGDWALFFLLIYRPK